MRKFCLLFTLLTLLAQAAIAKPAIFSELSMAEAKAAAQQQHKLLLADFTATWCRPCKSMDETTWSDAAVAQWIRANAIAVQIDVDGQKDLAHSLAVHSMPTIIVFKPDEQTTEFDRDIGYKTPAELLSWLNQVKAGGRIIDSLKRKYDAAVGKGGEPEVSARYESAGYYLHSGDYAKATDEFQWLWQNMDREYPPTAGVRSSYLLHQIRQLVSRFDDARDRFSKLRDEAETTNRHDWILLNRALGEDQRTVDWFDGMEKDASQRTELAGNEHLLQDLLIERERWADAGRLYRNPLDNIRQLNRIKLALGPSAGKYDPFPQNAATIYAALLAAGRDSDADAVASESLRLDDSSELRHELVRKATAAGQFRPSMILIMLGDVTTLLILTIAILIILIVRYAIDHHNNRVLVNRSVLETALNQLNEALNDCKKVIAKCSRFPRSIWSKRLVALAYNNIAVVYARQGKFTEAVEASQQSAAFASDPMIYANHAWTLILAGKLQEAAEWLQKSFKLSPNVPRAYWIRYRLHQQLGQETEAESDKAKALSLGYKPDASLPLE